jgi:hypothetical protein
MSLQAHAPPAKTYIQLQYWHDRTVPRPEMPPLGAFASRIEIDLS